MQKQNITSVSTLKLLKYNWRELKKTQIINKILRQYHCFKLGSIGYESH